MKTATKQLLLQFSEIPSKIFEIERDLKLFVKLQFSKDPIKPENLKAYQLFLLDTKPPQLGEWFFSDQYGQIEKAVIIENGLVNGYILKYCRRVIASSVELTTDGFSRQSDLENDYCQNPLPTFSKDFLQNFVKDFNQSLISSFEKVLVEVDDKDEILLNNKNELTSYELEIEVPTRLIHEMKELIITKDEAEKILEKTKETLKRKKTISETKTITGNRINSDGTIGEPFIWVVSRSFWKMLEHGAYGLSKPIELKIGKVNNQIEITKIEDTIHIKN